MPLGWRPEDVACTSPVYKIEDVYNFEKYAPLYSSRLLVWWWAQLISVLLLVSYLFGNISLINIPGVFIYGAFIFLSVYAFTELMDRNRNAIFWELGKNTLGCYLIVSSGDWFHSRVYADWISYIVFGWFVFSSMITAWFIFIEFKEDAPLKIA